MMSEKKSRLIFRIVFITLWVLILAGIYYWNSLMQARIRDLEETQAEITDALEKLSASNDTYLLNLKRQHVNLRECMAKLPQAEVDDFYRRHREEFQKKK